MDYKHSDTTRSRRPSASERSCGLEAFSHRLALEVTQHGIWATKLIDMDIEFLAVWSGIPFRYQPSVSTVLEWIYSHGHGHGYGYGDDGLGVLDLDLIMHTWMGGGCLE